ncbi:MAG TPA: fumarylacetoacetate hydrolase family protein [Jiangellales bacterium]|nr:fumarylacetoacetate hydrolase family protein [Jiangellales bacterium]
MSNPEAGSLGIWRVSLGEQTRLARGPVADGPADLLPDTSLDELLAEGGRTLAEALAAPAGDPVPAGARVVTPIGGQEVWAAGVTYERSRDARMDESDTPDHYDRVYDADRPELFLKASPGRAVGPGEPVGIRADSAWDAPEPELGVIANANGDLVAYVLGNDMSSRSIEGDNPLYLPQAKVYTGSCALGPCLVPVEQAPALDEIGLELDVARDGRTVVAGSVELTRLRRSPDDLLGWLTRAMDFPVGVVLLTGTGIVPSAEFTLQPGDVVTITGTGLGTLRNPVIQVGK